MIPSLKVIEDYDMIFFTPGEDEENSHEVRSALYKNPGEKLDIGQMGDTYDIILFRMDQEENVKDLERFSGVLIDPREYVSRLIKEDWFGMVAKKTTTSEKVVGDVFASWTNL